MRNIIPARQGPAPVISHEQPKPMVPAIRPEAVAAGDRAIAAAQARQQSMLSHFERAQADLRVLTPASAVEKIQQLPFIPQQVYLIAEEEGQARPFILRYFPKSSPSVRGRIFPPQSAPAAVSPTAAPKSGAARRRRAPKE